MSAWPPNPYLDAFLRSDEGQAYMAKHGCLDAWKRRHLLDDPDIPLRVEQGESQFWLMNPEAPIQTGKLTPADPWDF